MKTNLRLLVLSLVILTTFSITAQNKEATILKQSNNIILISVDSVGNEVARMLAKTVSPKFNDHNTPSYLLTSKNDNFALGIGGNILAVASYDFGGIVKDISFNTAKIPTRTSTAARNQYQMDISHSSLFLKLLGKTKRLGDIVVFINGNFSGNNYAFDLQNAYVQFLGFLVGYNYGSFMDLPAVAPTIDFYGPCGMVNYKVTQLSYTYDQIKNWSFTGSIEMPTVHTTQASNLEGYNLEESVQRMPNFSANAQYNWGTSSQIRAAAIVRSMTYNRFHDNIPKTNSILGWGAQLSTIFNVSQNLKMFGQMTYGKGIGTFIKDLDELKIDLVPDLNTPGKMQAIPTLGWYAGLRYDFTPAFFISTTYSQSRIYAENGWPVNNSDFYKQGQYLVANAFWNITPNMQAGIEYLRGWRSGFADNSIRHANRLNLMLQYSF